MKRRGGSYQGLNWNISPLHNHPFASKHGYPSKVVFTFVLPQILDWQLIKVNINTFLFKSHTHIAFFAQQSPIYEMSPLRYPYFGTVVGACMAELSWQLCCQQHSYCKDLPCPRGQRWWPNKKWCTGPPGWGSGMGLTTPPHKKICSVEKLLNLETGQWRALLKEAEVPPRTVVPEK